MLNISAQLLFLCSQISNIFNVSPVEENVESVDDADETAFSNNAIQRWTCEGNGYAMDIVKVAGLLQNESREQDAAIMTALASFLKKESPDRIPTVLFITARVNGSQSEGDQSRFSTMLKYLFQARSLLTDTACSNVILLLTHSDTSEVKSDIIRSGESYQNAFSSIFMVEGSGEPERRSHLMALGNTPISLQQLMDSFRNAQLTNSEYKLLSKLARSNLMAEGTTASYSYQDLKVQDLVPPKHIPRIRQVLSNTSNDSEPMNPTFFEGDWSDDDDVASSDSQYNKSIIVGVDILPESAQTSLSLTLIHNCVHPNCAIVLASGKPTVVADLFVGDRVLGLNNKVGIITKICKIYRGQRVATDSTNNLRSFGCVDCGDKRFINLCMIYVKGVTTMASTGPTAQNDAYLTAYHEVNETFLPRKSHNDIQRLHIANMKSLVYYVEVDNGYGTFVADGFVRACKEYAVLKHIRLNKSTR